MVTFADPAVEEICLVNWDTDGNGILMKSEAEVVKSLGSVYRGNAEITSFDELNFFTSVKTMNDGLFAGCSALLSIGLDNVVTLSRTANTGTFDGCTSLKRVVLPKITTLLWSFMNCTSLTFADLGEDCTSIGWRTFQNCPMETLICRAVNPPTMGDTTLKSTCIIYVPDESVDAYKAASGWSGRAAYIKQLSEYTE